MNGVICGCRNLSMPSGRVALACSVRGCGSPLERRERAFVCPRGHTYDVARVGYVNLLQPQDRRSLSAGDAKAIVDARARLLQANVGRIILDRFTQHAAALELSEDPLVVELGAGSGDALAALAQARPITGVGIDLSTAAAEHAARRFPGLTWVVANADRRLPLLDHSVELVLSMHARRNPAECARVLVRAGFLLVSVPAQDDLLELREFVQGRAIERDRARAMVAEHEPFFTLLERSSVRERQRLERESLLDLLKGTYRGERLSGADRLEALDSLEVTLASEFCLFASR
jgi:23S rRNA (guanine745-N1)-methyltransferase